MIWSQTLLAKRETKKLNEDFRHKCIVTTSSNAWMNEEFDSELG